MQKAFFANGAVIDGKFYANIFAAGFDAPPPGVQLGVEVEFPEAETIELPSTFPDYPLPPAPVTPEGEVLLPQVWEPPTVKVKYHSDAARGIKQAHVGEWIDLRAAEDVMMKAGEFKYIDLGVSIKVPEGYESILAPRSSTFKKYGLLQTNSIGVVDHAYCGNGDVWKFPAYATRDTEIKAGERIAQFRIQPIQGAVEIVEVDDMEVEDRGGLGSTGTF